MITADVTTPRNDGTPGSALYAVPLRLSRAAPLEWQKLFVHYWNNPPSFSTMHRPGIAKAYGDRVVLDGTTLEEIQKVHTRTLKLVLEKTNEHYRAAMEERQQREDVAQSRERQHREFVERFSKEIDFG
ncbi:MAG: hypothetical protein F4Y71_02685 [Acidobacteria bacterium]|nr:hypothetical protein [Acidobacteriota bacterium]